MTGSAIGEAWTTAGGTVMRLGRFWDPPALNPATVRIYGNDTFALVLAQKIGLHLVSPPDDLLAQLTPEWLKRRLEIRALSEAGSFPYPVFVKPVVPKQFAAAVYPDANALVAECRGLASEARVFVAEPVRFVAEARCFVLAGEVRDVSLYAGEATVEDAAPLTRQVAHCRLLPKTCVGHLPRFDVGSGFVIDLQNNISKQTDVIIYDALNCPVYRASDTAAIIPSDNVASVIEVKSRSPLRS